MAELREEKWDRSPRRLTKRSKEDEGRCPACPKSMQSNPRQHVNYRADPIREIVHEAIRTAQQQKLISLMKRAEKAYAEYRSQKANALGSHDFQLSLW